MEYDFILNSRRRVFDLEIEGYRLNIQRSTYMSIGVALGGFLAVIEAKGKPSTLLISMPDIILVVDTAKVLIKLSIQYLLQ